MINYSKSTYNKLKLNWFCLFIIGLIISILLSLALYNFINPDNRNNILSKNMLIAIKKFDFSIADMLKKNFTYRLIEIIILIIFLLTGLRNKVLNILWFYIGIRIGFFSTIFIKEMGYIGIINLIIISFPHRLFYYTTLFCLISLIYQNKEYISDYSTRSKLFDKIAPYLNIILLWCSGILSETIINLFLVQKLFII